MWRNGLLVRTCTHGCLIHDRLREGPHPSVWGFVLIMIRFTFRLTHPTLLGSMLGWVRCGIWRAGLEGCGYYTCSTQLSESVVAERSSALDSSSGVARMWVRIPAWPVAALVSLSKTLNHNCFVLRMGRKAVGPVCCVMHVKEPRTLIVKEKGLAPVFLDSRLEHPAGWICARYKSYHYYLFTQLKF